ncbi:Hypothetical predicted protein, partial [Pelobates cultripes]
TASALLTTTYSVGNEQRYKMEAESSALPSPKQSSKAEGTGEARASLGAHHIKRDP